MRRPSSRHEATSILAERARAMRHSATPSEQALWRELSGSKLGVAFRRQVVIGRFIADFAAPAAKIVIEVDGPYHAGRRAADARRDRVLARLGWRVLRLDAELVLNAPGQAVARIRELLLPG